MPDKSISSVIDALSRVDSVECFALFLFPMRIEIFLKNCPLKLDFFALKCYTIIYRRNIKSAEKV